jgi:3-phosphoglycerate kinase
MNIYSDLRRNERPIILRIDINCPVNNNQRILPNGHINLRLEQNGFLLKAYSKLGPLLILAHQGRSNPPGVKPDKNFTSLLDHHQILSAISEVPIHFIKHAEGESWRDYSNHVGKHLKTLKKGEAILMDNVRIWDFESKFDSKKCPYINFFNEYNPAAFINDALPVWHRKDSSLLFGRHVAPTYIGHISLKELRIQYKILHSTEKKAIIIGGKKPKFNAIPNLAKIMDIYTAGITGILTTKLSGNEVGPRNEALLDDTFKGLDKEIKEYQRIVDEYPIKHPIDFVLSQSENFSRSNRHNVSLKDLNKPEYEDYEICDIGIDTVKEYSNAINTGKYDWRIRAGPNGIYEEGFDNGIKLIEYILGTGFVALGGDTIEELQSYEICKTIIYSDGAVLLGGGSHLDGFAGKPYPCIQDLVKNGCVTPRSEPKAQKPFS